MSKHAAAVDLPGMSRERAAVAAPLMARVMEAVQQLFAEAPLDVLQRASAAPTGAGSLASLVSDLPEASPRLAAADPEASAVARASDVKRQLLESTPTYSTAEVATILGMSTEGVRKRRLADRLLAVPLGSDWRFPAWQFAPSGQPGDSTVTGLERVLAAIPVGNPWVRLELLSAPAEELEGRSVVDLLRAGDVTGALDVVSRYGEHGA